MLFDLLDVTASRGGRVVLRGVDLALEEGATAVVGPSGSGKSTLLRLLNRLADPDTGEVLFRGRPLRAHDVLSLRRKVALVPQLPALVEGSVAANVELGARLAGWSADVDRALSLAGLDPTFGPRLADGLSVGEQQRVMLARALALERLASELDLSLIVVTHDPAQARRLARRTVTVAGGRVA